jgi:hypothetical protein
LAWARVYLFSTMTSGIKKSTQHIQSVLGVLSLEVSQLRHEVDNSLISCSVKLRMGAAIPVLPTCFHDVHTDNFTSTLALPTCSVTSEEKGVHSFGHELP